MAKTSSAPFNRICTSCFAAAYNIILSADSNHDLVKSTVPSISQRGKAPSHQILYPHCPFCSFCHGRSGLIFLSHTRSLESSIPSLSLLLTPTPASSSSRSSRRRCPLTITVPRTMRRSISSSPTSPPSVPSLHPLRASSTDRYSPANGSALSNKLVHVHALDVAPHRIRSAIEPAIPRQIDSGCSQPYATPTQNPPTDSGSALNSSHSCIGYATSLILSALRETTRTKSGWGSGLFA
ncbi:hypothetical protein BDV98DRAFT_204486 [Pterulicium gracile]|uniref:Uncharacterized protein n=1 Tax=Pterulicium gracile TaxID=1884261 RepID=A0A5C3Q8P4_9AGAR|nr:hypothetical protein BDV98DRAFT_204486 [Pterula gracilis]